MARKSRKKSHKLRFVAGAAALLIVLGGGAYLFVHHHNASKTPNEPAGVNLSPATPAEKQQSEENKDRIVQQQQQSTPTPSPTSKAQVSVIITDASASSVNAYVNG